MRIYFVMDIWDLRIMELFAKMNMVVIVGYGLCTLPVAGYAIWK